MKNVVTILLITMLVSYVMPVKVLLNSKAGICMTDITDNAEESSKKEKSKDLITTTNGMCFTKTHRYLYTPEAHQVSTSPFINIEIPPPDFI